MNECDSEMLGWPPSRLPSTSHWWQPRWALGTFRSSPTCSGLSARVPWPPRRCCSPGSCCGRNVVDWLWKTVRNVLDFAGSAVVPGPLLLDIGSRDETSRLGGDEDGALNGIVCPHLVHDFRQLLFHLDRQCIDLDGRRIIDCYFFLKIKSNKSKKYVVDLQWGWGTGFIIILLCCNVSLKKTQINSCQKSPIFFADFKIVNIVRLGPVLLPSSYLIMQRNMLNTYYQPHIKNYPICIGRRGGKSPRKPFIELTRKLPFSFLTAFRHCVKSGCALPWNWGRWFEPQQRRSWLHNWHVFGLRREGDNAPWDNYTVNRHYTEQVSDWSLLGIVKIRKLLIVMILMFVIIITNGLGW